MDKIKVRDIVEAIECVAPLKLQEDYDNAGFQVDSYAGEVTGVLTCLDVTERTIDEAMEKGANLIVSHHPLLFRPIKNIAPDNYIGRVILKAIKAGISIYSVHTNLDNAYGGVNYKMAEKLGLICVEPLVPLPPSRLVGVENAEMCGSGVVGILPEAMSADAFVEKVRETFRCGGNIRTNGVSGEIRKVALCGGSGAEFIADAKRKGANVFLTGEIGYHRFFGHDNILLVEAGHYETEQYTKELLKEIIQNKCPSIEVFLSRN